MKTIKITDTELREQTDAYIDAAISGDMVCVKKDGHYVCIIGEREWKLVIKAMKKLLRAPAK